MGEAEGRASTVFGAVEVRVSSVEEITQSGAAEMEQWGLPTCGRLAFVFLWANARQEEDTNHVR